MATFTQTKIRGHQCTLIFTGSHYYLHSSFFGLLGQATRNYAKADTNPVTGNAVGHFTLEVGNRRCNWPSSLIASYFKRLIEREENRYVDKEVTFEVKDFDGRKYNLKIEMV